MQKSKIIKCILILLSVMVLFTSCGKKAKDPVSGGLEDIDTGLSEPFTMILYQKYIYTESGIYSSENKDIYINEIEAQLKKKGFNINIEIIPLDDFLQNKEYGLQLLSENKNAAVSRMAILAVDLKELIDNGKIKEITADFKKYAPEYYEKTVGNKTINDLMRNNNAIIDDKIYGIPLGFEQNIDYPVLLVRKEISEKYKKDINSIEDYKNLLEWIKENQKQYKPGLFPIDINVFDTSISKSYSVFNFYACMTGYSAINGQISFGGGNYYYKSSDLESMIKAGRIDFTEATGLPGFKEFILMLTEWEKNDLVDFWTNKNFGKLTQGYATIITNASNYTNPVSVRDKRALINAEEYDMYLLNKDHLRISTAKSLNACKEVIYLGADSDNSSEIFRFIEWLYSDINNFELFMYGKENENDVTENDRVSWGKRQLSDFVRQNYDSRKDFYPNNWEDILKEISKIPQRDELSLINYVFENAVNGLEKVYEISSNISKYVYNGTSDERVAYPIGLIEFIKEIFLSGGYFLEGRLDKYLYDFSDMPIVQKTKEGYSKYIDALFECLKDGEK